MKEGTKQPLYKYHRFIDEAGDTTFYNKRKKVILGQDGVSNHFIIGMLTLSEPLEELRKSVQALQSRIAADPYYQVPSVLKKIGNKGYFLHAKDDIPEIRGEMFKFIKGIDCSFSAVVLKKKAEGFNGRYDNNARYLYADVLSHLLENQMNVQAERLVLNIADRGTSTKNKNLERALLQATERFKLTNPDLPVKVRVAFQVSTPLRDPLLNIADYLCWAVQRSIERGENRYREFMKDKITEVIQIE